MSDLRYPIGRFTFDPAVTDEKRRLWVAEIAAAPARLRAAVDGLDDVRLDTPYRPDGWTVRQVVHHVPDSHLNAYVRMRLALTETNPTIRAYDEAAWADLNDASIAPPSVSLALLEALHRRWVLLLTSLDSGRLDAAAPAPRGGADDARHPPPAVHVARAAPHGARHRAAQARGLGIGLA